MIQQDQQLAEHLAARTLLEERARIARELHDVVAHHMSVIAIQAEAAPYKVPIPPPELAAASPRSAAPRWRALTELRRILGVLRTDDGTADTAPQPGLDRLDELVTGARSRVWRSRPRSSGPAGRCPPASACRRTGSCRRR